jgi:hypothetical protein
LEGIIIFKESMQNIRNEGLKVFTKRAVGYFINTVRFYPPTFSGWGMTTIFTNPPWLSPSGGIDELTDGFLKVHNQMLELVNANEVILSQLPRETVIDTLKEVMWRNYIIYWCTIYAIKSTATPNKNIVECGVCDGMGIYFALSAARDQHQDIRCYLYDAWEGMKKEYLLDTELGQDGSYSYLQMDNTIRNLSPFKGNIFFNKGYIPDSFVSSKNPDSLVLLLIDLNSAIPTIKALDFFFDKLESGGIILFDDYSFLGYEDTKKYVDEWLKNKPGILLPMPTGQSIFFKH